MAKQSGTHDVQWYIKTKVLVHYEIHVVKQVDVNAGTLPETKNIGTQGLP